MAICKCDNHEWEKTAEWSEDSGNTWHDAFWCVWCHMQKFEIDGVVMAQLPSGFVLTDAASTNRVLIRALNYEQH